MCNGVNAVEIQFLLENVYNPKKWTKSGSIRHNIFANIFVYTHF